jgi:hypothetical protein
MSKAREIAERMFGAGYFVSKFHAEQAKKAIDAEVAPLVEALEEIALRGCIPCKVAKGRSCEDDWHCSAKDARDALEKWEGGEE